MLWRPQAQFAGLPLLQLLLPPAPKSGWRSPHLSQAESDAANPRRPMTRTMRFIGPTNVAIRPSF